jgi:hypothetical protein
VLNINTISIADYLYRNDAARTALVARAEAAAADTTFLSRNYQQAQAELDSIALPIGWGNMDFGFPGTKRAVVRETSAGQQKITLERGWWNYVFSPLFGWLLTAFAATLGAPFWFDLLNKLMVIRSTVKPHEKSPEEASEDRQFPRQGRANIAVVGQGNGGLGASQTPSQSSFTGQQQYVDVPTPLDAESDIDGCSAHNHNTIANQDITLDEELPPARGGVA